MKIVEEKKVEDSDIAIVVSMKNMDYAYEKESGKKNPQEILSRECTESAFRPMDVIVLEELERQYLSQTDVFGEGCYGVGEEDNDENFSLMDVITAEQPKDLTGDPSEKERYEDQTGWAPGQLIRELAASEQLLEELEHQCQSQTDVFGEGYFCIEDDDGNDNDCLMEVITAEQSKEFAGDRLEKESTGDRYEWVSGWLTRELVAAEKLLEEIELQRRPQADMFGEGCQGDNDDGGDDNACLMDVITAKQSKLAEDRFENERTGDQSGWVPGRLNRLLISA